MISPTLEPFPAGSALFATTVWRAIDQIGFWSPLGADCSPVFRPPLQSATGCDFCSTFNSQ